MKPVTLKSGREKSLLSRHPWIFSGAVQSLPEFTDGDVLPVQSNRGEHLGFGYFNRRSNIIGRMLSFDKTVDLEKLIKEAIVLRTVVPSNSNAIRLINGESDFCPGLIVDRYDNVLVVQISTLGMDKLKGQIVEILQRECKPVWIYESSTSPSRKEEGLNECKKTLFGNPVDDILVYENGLKFLVNPLKGQKTGFFQDLREMRLLIEQLAKGKRVLNCFSYTGAFSCYALKGDATHCLSVDISKEAIEQTKKHMELNGFEQARHSEVVADCFDFLRTDALNFDLVILDPPAFAKRKSDVTKALRGYQEINRTTLAKMPKNSLLLTCSCSYHVDDELFLKMLFHASREAKRDIRIIQRHRHAFDHPVSIYHPESNYLKGYLCYVT
ncbi:MAG: class I SAM-dependent rRNA methyltransferase [Verrucomicrobia bacterium]|nr:class I SAM-dependent rRNA methyltransferase [Verrucomicrobiota bacterium]